MVPPVVSSGDKPPDREGALSRLNGCPSGELCAEVYGEWCELKASIMPEFIRASGEEAILGVGSSAPSPATAQPSAEASYVASHERKA